jgi:L-ascorbate metabolism protein UlaG (beta-lactamase superfamily)
MKLSRRRLVAMLAAAGAGVAGLGLRTAAARYYEGPLSDHFDGLRFFDEHGMAPKSPRDLLRWWASNGKSRWPPRVVSVLSDTPPACVEGHGWRICFVGHATLLIQTASLNILIDPVWSERVSPVAFAGPRRVNDPGIAFSDLPPIDVVLLSHNHYDHFDIATLSQLAAVHRSRVVTPLGNDTILRAHDPAIRVEAYDWGDRVVLSPRVAVTLAPMRHWSARQVFDRNRALWAAFILDTPAGRIYHVADSGYGVGHHFRTARDRYGPFRLAILPIGAYEPRWFMRDQHMNPQDAVQAFQDCGAELALGHHYGTFQLTDEAIDEPRRALAVALAQAAIPAERFRALSPGEVWEL